MPSSRSVGLVLGPAWLLGLPHPYSGPSKSLLSFAPQRARNVCPPDQVPAGRGGKKNGGGKTYVKKRLRPWPGDRKTLARAARRSRQVLSAGQRI